MGLSFHGLVQKLLAFELELTLEEYKSEVIYGLLNQRPLGVPDACPFASVPLKSTKVSKVCTNGENNQKDKCLVMWF